MKRAAAAKRTSTPIDECLKLIAPPPPPSGALINVLLEHADIRHDIGQGMVLLRLSRQRLRDLDLRRSMGREARRLKDLSVVWDEEAGQIVRVCDDAEQGPPNDWTDHEPSELDGFELTQAALAYVADFERGRRTRFAG
jgi:hypothetical protein